MNLPKFYSREDASAIRVERAGLVAEEAKKNEALGPAREDRERIAAFGIDAQIAFCHPEGSLFVPGAVEDTTRALEFFYARLDRITTMVLSLDTHRVHQIFHPSFWVNRDGDHPAPFTVITKDDVAHGAWIPVRDRDACVEYVAKLEAAGKYVLTIWPYHALLGGVSHALVPAVMELAMFHALARDTETIFETKGENALTENYSVLSPEVTELASLKENARVGAFNVELFDLLMSHDRVYVFGQAKSHCVLSTLFDIRSQIEKTAGGNARALAKKIFVLQDTMSPVPPPPPAVLGGPLPPALDFPRVAERGLEALGAFGMNIVTTTSHA